MLRSVTANWGPAESNASGNDEFKRREIGRVAAELLLEQARRSRRIRQ